MSTIKVPRTIAGAKKELAAVEALLRAQQWERSAIVWAFTPDSEPGSQARFAAQGINGLSSATTVGLYHDAWQAMLDKGLVGPAWPGHSVVLPDAPWAYEPKNLRLSRERDPELTAAYEREAAVNRVSPNTVVQVANTPAAITAAILANPKTAAVAAEALAEVHDREYPQIKEALARSAKGRKEKKEVEDRSPSAEIVSLYQACKAIDRLAKGGHWEAITRVAEYCKVVAGMDDSQIAQFRDQLPELPADAEVSR